MLLVSTAPARATLWSVLSSVTLCSCFDVEQVDAYTAIDLAVRQVIDDFDDDADNSQFQPTDTRFRSWHCRRSSGLPGDGNCEPGPGLEGTTGRVLNFDLVDPLDEQLDYPFMELVTPAREPVDFSQYERFEFSARLQPSPGDTPATIRLACQLYCTSLASDAFVEARVLVASDLQWHTYERRFAASFRQPQWQKDEWLEQGRLLIDSAACMERVDVLGIVLMPELVDGQRTSGALYLDEIYVQ